MNEDRAREAIDHLQTAALEVIAAVRALLDVAEDLVRDPNPRRPPGDSSRRPSGDSTRRPSGGADAGITHIDVDS